MSKIPQEAIELLPCPFCGYAITAQEGVCPVDDYVCEETGEWKFKGICCPTCAVFLPASDNASTVYDGVAAWNSRPAFTADAARAQGTEDARSEACALAERAGIEIGDDHDMFVADLTETLIRFADSRAALAGGEA